MALRATKGDEDADGADAHLRRFFADSSRERRASGARKGLCRQGLQAPRRVLARQTESYPRSRIANQSNPNSSSADADTCTGRSARAIRATRENSSAMTEMAAISANAAPAST